jgi:ubiquinone/menaquinone biosynthesis C-methylase UbiE
MQEDDKKEIWNRHWHNLSKKRSFFGKFLEFYRKYIISNSVSHYLDKYFLKEGIFVECGSGTSQASVKVSKFNRNLIALDISSVVLLEAHKTRLMNSFVNGDIMKLPFKDNSVDGIWNLGVMEHFTQPQIDIILKEFRRVLKKNGVCILFWPPSHAPYRIILNLMEGIANRLLKKKIQFFPEEPSQLYSRNEAMKILKRNKFSTCFVHYTMRDLFTYCVIVCRK